MKQIKELAKIDQQKSEKSYWDLLISGIVRPPRADYRDTQLGIFDLM